ncbi:MAG: PAS domain S-box protein, partial [Mariprofundus sp.]|nr:PAS domain S-box protein [Mariprofundus sp.]
ELLSGFNQMADEIQRSFVTIKAQNEALKQSEQLLRNMIEMAPMPVLISSRDEGRILFFNAAVAHMFGVDNRADSTLLTTMFYRRPEERRSLLLLLEQGGEVLGKEVEMLRVDGTAMWLSISMCNIEFEGTTALFTAFADITDQKHHEKILENQVAARTQELKLARDELQSTLDNMLDTYYRIAPNGTLVWASESMQSLLGYTVAQATGQTLASLSDGTVDYHRAVDKLVKSGGQLMNQKIILKHAKGHQIWVSVSARLIRDAENKTAGIEGVLRDITAQVVAEEQKLEMEKKMAHVQRLESLGVLAGGIAHDFNNILAGIMGNAELAEIHLHEKLPMAKELQNIVTSSLRAADLCKQMLAYSGQGTVMRQALDLSELVSETIHLIDASISKQVELRCELKSPMPPIMADRTQMQQIIMNLVTNASEAIGDHETGVICVKTGVIQAGMGDLDSPFFEEKQPQGEYVYLHVNDNGCGMHPDIQKKIFDPFFTTKFTGRGLGMSAVLGIVRSHKGTLHLDSQSGSGSCFSIYFPVCQAVKIEHMPKIPQRAPSMACNVLVVDDEAVVRTAVKGLLGKLGCSVFLAEDGARGIEVYRQHAGEIDLVLLDMTMPKLGGVETLEALRQIQPELPVFICSGYSNEKVAGQFHQDRPNGYLHKPFSLAALRDILAQISDQYG